MTFNVFNFIAATYLVIIAVVSIIKLRWFLTLTVSLKIRHAFTITTTYFAFAVILLIAVLLVAISLTSTLNLLSRHYVSPEEDAIHHLPAISTVQATPTSSATSVKRPESRVHPDRSSKHVIVKDSMGSRPSNARVFCSNFVHLILAMLLIVALIIWLLNTGELLRESIWAQLELAYQRFQFSDRTNHFTVAIEAMQDINSCCGLLIYTDFPHQRLSGLSNGNYPGSCCGKSIFGFNSRSLCKPEEILANKQSVSEQSNRNFQPDTIRTPTNRSKPFSCVLEQSGCATVVAGYFDLISMLVVPVLLSCLLVNMATIALVSLPQEYLALLANKPRLAANEKFELIPAG